MPMEDRVRYQSFISDSGRWDGFDLRDDDIVISTPPKSGTTWMQMLCALLIFQDPELPSPLAELSPWLDMLTWQLEEVRSLLDAQEHRRFIKSHTPLDGLPFDPRVTYICVGRDPRDVALSWENHLLNTDLEKLFGARAVAVGLDDLAGQPVPEPPPEDPRERFWLWIEHPDAPEDRHMCLESVLHHVDTFWSRRHEPNVSLFHYADLKADLPGELARLASVLGIELSRERITELAQAATFEEMKRKADQLAPDTTHGIWLDNRGFFHHGRTGRWRDIVPDGDSSRYHDRVAALVDGELAAWLHP